jgi:hypothetical protein
MNGLVTSLLIAYMLLQQRIILASIAPERKLDSTLPSDRPWIAYQYFHSTM